jgi:hypothetical protein
VKDSDVSIMSGPNVVVDWLALLLLIRDVMVQILGRRPVIVTEVFVVCWNTALNLGQDRFLPNHCQFIIHLSPFHSTMYSLVTEKAPLNKLQKINRMSRAAVGKLRPAGRLWPSQTFHSPMRKGQTVPATGVAGVTVQRWVISSFKPFEI